MSRRSQHSIQQEVHLFTSSVALVFPSFEYLVSGVDGLVYHLVVKHDKDQTYVQRLLIVSHQLP